MIANVNKESFRYFFRAGTGSASTLEGVLDFDRAVEVWNELSPSGDRPINAAQIREPLEDMYARMHSRDLPAAPLVVSVAEPGSQGRYAFVAGGFGRPHSRETIQVALGVSPSSASSSMELDDEQVSRGGNTDASTFFTSHVST